jgi:hypothetical protein
MIKTNRSSLTGSEGVSLERPELERIVDEEKSGQLHRQPRHQHGLEQEASEAPLEQVKVQVEFAMSCVVEDEYLDADDDQNGYENVAESADVTDFEQFG